MGACPWTPLVACAFDARGHDYCTPQTPLFSVDRVAISVISRQYLFVIKGKGYENELNDHQRENALIFSEILFTDFTTNL